METRQKTWNLNNFFVSTTFIFVFEKSQFVFMSLAFMWSILVWEIPDFTFRQMLQIFKVIIVLFQKEGTLRIIKTNILICAPKTTIFIALGLKIKFFTFNANLTNFSSMLLLSRKQSIDFLSKSMTQFLYNNITGLKQVNKGT